MSVNDILSALSDENRRKILEILRQGRTNTGDLAQSLQITPQALSYHLKKLKKLLTMVVRCCIIIPLPLRQTNF